MNPDMDGLDYYLVGGAVRDRIMGKEPEDKDYVVVNSNPQEMIDRGFEEVGESFPVYLHPETKQEFALARTEENVGEGYNSFNVDTKNVTLEEDLARRDLTINAIAEKVSEDGKPTGFRIDPFGGEVDIERGILRHCTKAFSEDPVRVLRLARFASRFGFDVYPGTIELAKEVSFELPSEPGERLFGEIKKTFQQMDYPRRFFDTLQLTNALQYVIPPLYQMINIPAGPQENHKEDCYDHTIMVIEELYKKYENNPLVMFMGLAHDFGKIRTRVEEWPNHYNHDKKGVEIAEDMAEHWKAPNTVEDVMKKASKQHIRMKNMHEMKWSKLIRLSDRVSFVDEELKELVCADKRGRISSKASKWDSEWEDIEEGFRRYDLAKASKKYITGKVLKKLHGDELSGKQFGERLLQLRVEWCKLVDNMRSYEKGQEFESAKQNIIETRGSGDS